MAQGDGHLLADLPAGVEVGARDQVSASIERTRHALEQRDPVEDVELGRNDVGGDTAFPDEPGPASR